jgi:transposase
MNPYPAPRSVLVLDNCRIHHVEEAEEMCNAKYVQLESVHLKNNNEAGRGVKLIYISPYSPDFNPIEECFSWNKHHICRHG